MLFADWSRLPTELRPKVRKRRKVKSVAKPNLSAAAQKIKPEAILEVCYSPQIIY